MIRSGKLGHYEGMRIVETRRRAGNHGSEAMALKSLPRGTEVVCPGCGAKVWTAKKIVVIGESLALNAVKFERGQEKRVGEKPVCTACQTPYSRGHAAYGPQLHTRHGWRPVP